MKNAIRMLIITALFVSLTSCYSSIGIKKISSKEYSEIKNNLSSVIDTTVIDGIEITNVVCPIGEKYEKIIITPKDGSEPVSFTPITEFENDLPVRYNYIGNINGYYLIIRYREGDSYGILINANNGEKLMLRGYVIAILNGGVILSTNARAALGDRNEPIDSWGLYEYNGEKYVNTFKGESTKWMVCDIKQISKTEIALIFDSYSSSDGYNQLSEKLKGFYIINVDFFDKFISNF